jgi:hypothetical protein
VLLYGSEVWGTSMVNEINKEERFLFNLSKNMYQLFMFNDFNDLETLKASDIRTSSDFN